MSNPRTTAAFPFLLVLALSLTAYADGPRDNDPSTVRQVPPAGVEVSAEWQEKIMPAMDELAAEIEAIRKTKDARRIALLPDVIIFHRAVKDAITYNEFFKAGDIPKAVQLLKAGMERARALKEGDSPWTTQTGLVVRGFVSKLDGSVQPYGLVIPENLDPKSPFEYRCDVWFHGRGETLSEVNFLDQRMKQVGRIQPRNTIVLHPYGRYSNAFKFAGEVDVFEALDHVKANYPVDEDRVAVRGFSMGGAGCWQMAVHYPDVWFAATPGAGFSETPRFLESFQKETLDPTWFEKKLWHWYDCPDYAVNLANLPTIAYSGELDIQKQAADVMEETMAAQQMRLVHIIGPQTKHAIHPDSLKEIESRLSSLARKGRDVLPQSVWLETATLKYNRSFWVTIDALQEHWERSRVLSRWQEDNTIRVLAQGVDALSFDMKAGTCPFDPFKPVMVVVNRRAVQCPAPGSDRSWSCSIVRDGIGWKLVDPSEPQEGLRKKHNLQGPIDDALMDSFLFVRPTGKSSNAKFESWCTAELDRAIEHWRRHFRGHVRIKDDKDVTEDDIASHNLILWGDAESNSLISKVNPELPIQWNSESISAPGQANAFASSDHALILVYPNPLNPERYVVYNSSFTYREYAYLNNARQVPMLPDWAIINFDEPPGTQRPGRIVAADFFDERWQLKESGVSEPGR